jgi:hypothetical protein
MTRNLQRQNLGHGLLLLAGLSWQKGLFKLSSLFFIFISSRGIQKNPERPLRDYPTFLLLIFTIFGVGFTRLLIGFLSSTCRLLPPSSLSG